MRKNFLLKYKLVLPTRFEMDYLRYEITKISGRKCFCYLQGGDYEFLNLIFKFRVGIMNLRIWIFKFIIPTLKMTKNTFYLKFS